MKRSWRRRLLGLAIFLLVAGLVAALVHWGVNRLLHERIQTAAGNAICQKTTLGSARLRWHNGMLELRDLEAANPAGFLHPSFLKLGVGELDIHPASLLTDTVQIDEMTFDGLEIVLEQDVLRNNMQEIFHDIRVHNAASPDRGRKLAVQHLRAVRTTLLLSIRTLPGVKPDVYRIAISPLEMTHPVNADGSLMRTGEFTVYLLKQLARHAAEEPGLQTTPRLVLKNLAAALGTPTSTSSQATQSTAPAPASSSP
jgi:hypothetical protein